MTHTYGPIQSDTTVSLARHVSAEHLLLRIEPECVCVCVCLCVCVYEETQICHAMNPCIVTNYK